jgi:hypothetical protein
MYTTLVRAKATIRGEEAPPLTALTEHALKICDPDFVPGMGILEEDAERGLRCPLRGCGKWYHELGKHLESHDSDARVSRYPRGVRACLRGEAMAYTRSATKNALIDVLGLDPRCTFRSVNMTVRTMATKRQTDRCNRLFRQIAEIPDPTPREKRLVREYERDWYRVVGTSEERESAQTEFLTAALGCLRKRGVDEIRSYRDDIAERARRTRAKEGMSKRADKERIAHDLTARAPARVAHSMGLRNMFNLCDAQLSQRVLSLRDMIHRWPTVHDAMEHDPKLLGAMALLDMEWEDVCAWTRLKAGMANDGGKADAARLLLRWAEVNGRLPDDADLRSAVPLLPPRERLLRAMGARDWQHMISMVRSIGRTHGTTA